MNGQPNPAVMEAELKSFKEIVYRLLHLSEQQAEFNGDIKIAVRLLQNEQRQHIDDFKKYTEPKITALWESKNQQSGGWSALKIIGTVFASSAAILGTAVTIIKLIHPS